jgi:hypothetical protein
MTWSTAGLACLLAVSLACLGASLVPTDPPIGEPRVYTGLPIPILYPGETVSAAISRQDIEAAVRSGRSTVEITGAFLVEPMPGWRGRWVRWQYRVLWRWFSTAPPRLQMTVHSDKTLKS